MTITNSSTIWVYAFQNCTNLTSIVIPNSVKTIENSAFSGCTSLTSFVIPDGVTSIGDSAFSGCTSLTSIVIPNSVKTIGSSAFSGCSNLTSIIIPDSVTSIGENAFSGCSNLTSITLPFIGESRLPKASLSYFGYFFGTSSYSNSVATKQNNTTYYIPLALISVTITDSNSIGSYAFQNCTSLTRIIIPDTITTIGYYAFNGCSSLTIYAETDIKPSGWNIDWNPDGQPVVWGYKG